METTKKTIIFENDTIEKIDPENIGKVRRVEIHTNYQRR